MTRIFTVHTRNNELSFLTIDGAIRAIANARGRVHLRSTLGNPEDCADFWE